MCKTMKYKIILNIQLCRLIIILYIITAKISMHNTRNFCEFQVKKHPPLPGGEKIYFLSLKREIT